MNDSGFVDHCLELLSPLGSTRAKRMFGGHGLYIDGLCMALVFRDTLYLKVDDANRAAFEAAHCQPFIYETKNGDHGSLNYCTAPEEAMESPHEMIPWARRALAAAVAARAKTVPKKKKTSAAPPVATRAGAKAAAKTVATEKAGAAKTSSKPSSQPSSKPTSTPTPPAAPRKKATAAPAAPKAPAASATTPARRSRTSSTS